MFNVDATVKSKSIHYCLWEPFSTLGGYMLPDENNVIIDSTATLLFGVFLSNVYCCWILLITSLKRVVRSSHYWMFSLVWVFGPSLLLVSFLFSPYFIFLCLSLYQFTPATLLKTMHKLESSKMETLGKVLNVACWVSISVADLVTFLTIFQNPLMTFFPKSTQRHFLPLLATFCANMASRSANRPALHRDPSSIHSERWWSVLMHACSYYLTDQW